MTNTPILDRQHTALLIMDFQNGIVPLATDTHWAQTEHPDLLDKTAAVLAAARDAGLKIIYIVVSFREGHPEVSERNRSFAAIKGSGRMLEGRSDTAIHPQVAPRPDEIVIAKQRVGAFSTTNLETILRAQNITSLILCGIATSGVVLSTVRWAADMDYELVVVEDCCADSDEEVHRVLTQKVFPRQARVVSAQEIIEDLK
jgi:nicotinamidase-related amidase